MWCTQKAPGRQHLHVTPATTTQRCNTPLRWIFRRFPEIIGEDNLTMFSYSGRVKSPEWRPQLRRADLRHFEIFRHGPIIIYTRLPAEVTYYPICRFPASSECLIGISDAFSAFCLRVSVSVIFPRAHCTPNKSVPTLCYTRRHGPIYTGPCPKAHTECSPLDFRRSSIALYFNFNFISLISNHMRQKHSEFAEGKRIRTCPQNASNNKKSAG